MHLHKKIGVVVAMVSGLMCFGCSKTQASAPSVDPQTLLQAAHVYGANHTPDPDPAIASPDNPTTIAVADDSAEYQAQVALWLANRDFDKLDQEAREARTSKARMRGGLWKLSVFYDGTGYPATTDKATDEEWETHIATIKDWIKARPESAAARISLAAAYNYYAEKARGTGYASTVSGSDWDRVRERDNLAESALLDAVNLREKDPIWYEFMQDIALLEDWPKPDARVLFEDAVAFEPSYMVFYREYANYILPQWNGQPGEIEAFAVEAAEHAKGKQADYLYFEIASMVICPCGADSGDMKNLSWPRVESGYAALVQMYGTSRKRANRYAHMAVVAQDKPEARAAFEVVGENYEPGAWHGRADFDRSRAWAMN